MPLRSLEELEQLRSAVQARRDPQRARVAVSCTGCIPSRAEQVACAFEEEIRRRGLETAVDVVRAGCSGPCRGQVVTVWPARVCYLGVQPAHVADILSQSLSLGGGQ